MADLGITLSQQSELNLFAGSFPRVEVPIVIVAVQEYWLKARCLVNYRTVTTMRIVTQITWLGSRKINIS